MILGPLQYVARGAALEMVEMRHLHLDFHIRAPTLHYVALGGIKERVKIQHLDFRTQAPIQCVAQLRMAIEMVMKVHQQIYVLVQYNVETTVSSAANNQL